MIKNFEKIRKAKNLGYYIPTRHPNAIAGNVPFEFFDNPEECEEAQKLATSVMEFSEKEYK